MTDASADARRGLVGLAACLGASIIWGLSPLYYAALDHVPAIDIIAHRTVWSAVLFAAILSATGRLGALRRVMSDRGAMVRLTLAAILISVNWLVFVLAVQRGSVIEASLGYYIFPLVAVALGFVAYGERPSRLQWTAVTLASAGVLVLSIGLGVAPWISLLLAGSFATYGTLKRGLATHATVSVTVEVALLAPFALAFIAVRDGAHFDEGLLTQALLIGTGPLTALPLVLFAVAAQRLHFATLGIFFYVNPTLQFLIGVTVFAQAFTPWHQVAFPLIWLAVSLYSWSLWRSSRRSRRAAMAASASGTT